MPKFYIYLYYNLLRNDAPWTPDDPDYVGEGTEDRPYLHLQEHELSKLTYFHNHLRKMLNAGNHPKIVVLLEAYNSKEEVQEQETALIQSYGKLCDKTGCLYNLTNGGSGISGHPYTPTIKTRQLLSHSLKGNQHAKGTISEKRIPILAFKDGKIVHRFEFLREAESKGFKPSSVSAALDEKQETAYGFNWMREEDYRVELINLGLSPELLPNFRWEGKFDVGRNSLKNLGSNPNRYCIRDWDSDL